VTTSAWSRSTTTLTLSSPAAPASFTAKQGLLGFLNWAHNGIREIIRVQSYAQQGNKLFAEIDMDVHASKDRPNFPFKALKKGEMTTVKFFVAYTFAPDGKIKSSNQPRGPRSTR
jgi:hypothetical protein